ncbi:hypothetical protein BKI52_34105 [marine bacterium AO1-C]|nr:hypothetical protein BKI52_34105 [marine bacterium AO1-C]
MYQIEILYKDETFKIYAMQTIAQYLGCSLKEAKEKIWGELNKEYTWITLDLPKAEFEMAYWRFSDVGFHIRRMKDLNAKLDIAYVEANFSDMWQENADNYYLEKGEMYGDVYYSIFMKEPPRFCSIEDELIVDYVVKKMLEVGVEVIEK